MSASKRLRAVLDQRGLSIKDAADLCGIPYRTLQNYLLDERDPNAKSLVAISTKLGISIDWLLTGDGPMVRGEQDPAPTPAQQAPTSSEISPREQAILELFRSLGEDDQREIQDAAAEKKRLTAIEQRLEELAAAVADIKRPA